MHNGWSCSIFRFLHARPLLTSVPCVRGSVNWQYGPPAPHTSITPTNYQTRVSSWPVSANRKWIILNCQFSLWVWEDIWELETDIHRVRASLDQSSVRETIYAREKYSSHKRIAISTSLFCRFIRNLNVMNKIELEVQTVMVLSD